MIKNIKITGLDCPNCALELQEEIEKVSGVKECKVDYVNQKVTIDYQEDEIVDKVKDICNHFEEVKVVDDNAFSFFIEGLDCADCAEELQEEIEKIDGVIEAHVDFMKQKVTVVLLNKETLVKVKDICNHFEEVKVVDAVDPNAKISHKKEIITIALSAVFYLIGMIIKLVFKFEYSLFELEATNINGHYFLYIVSMIAFFAGYLVVGFSVLKNTVKNILKGNVFDENFLMAVASIGAMVIGELSEGVMVVLLYEIGELLQSIAVESSRGSITSLVDLKSESATLVVGKETKVVAPDQLKIGDIIEVKKGEKVAVDAILVEGSTSFDTKSLTGEAMLRDCQKGDHVLSGFINEGSVVRVKAEKSYSDSTVSKILELVENTSTSKSRPEKFITKFAKIYTPIVCLIAAAVAIIVPLIISLVNGNWQANYLSWIYRALTMLVISCPCAVVISVPLTYFGGVGECAKVGALVKGTTYLDDLSHIAVAAFDKTGTLTEGVFEVKDVVSEDKDLTLKVACIAEKGSNHPIAQAFSKYNETENAEYIEEIAGEGIKCKYKNKVYYVGNYKIVKDNNIACKEVETNSTIIYVCSSSKLIGYITLDDRVKENVHSTLKILKELGVGELVMLTGDNVSRGEEVAKEVGIDKVYGGLLPDEKLNCAKELLKQGKLLYVGDGINDTPVMALSDVAISMGKLGSDAAIEASDIVLINDHFEDIAKAMKISKKTKEIVKENIYFAIIAKVIFMILGLCNLIPLWVAVFGDVGVMLICVFNTFRIHIAKRLNNMIN